MATPETKILPLPADGVGSFEWWKGQTEWAAEIRKDLLPGWRRHANAYRDRLKPPVTANGIGIRVNIEFEKTEQKRHQLFFRLPKFKLKASPGTIREANDPQSPQRDLKKAIAIFQEVLTRIVGPKGADTKPTMDELIFDVLCPSGIAFAKVGYERYTDGQVLLPTGAMIPDPEFTGQPGAVLGLGVEPPMIPERAPAPNIVHENYYLSRISPALGLIPAEFRGSNYSKEADWLGHDFFITKAEAKRLGWTVGANVSDATETDEDRIVPLDRKGNRSDQLRAREIFYYAARVDANVKHPLKIRRLVFIEGQLSPVVHQDYRDQRWDARGRLTGGLKTLPIKVLTTRYVSDSAHPPSDCAISARATDEVSEFRTQQVVHRRKSIPRTAIDIDKILDQKTKDRILAGEHYDDIPVNGDPRNLAAEIARPNYPHENRIANDMIQSDINRLWALGANSSTVTEAGSTTATEIASIERATTNRLSGERQKVVNQFWLDVVESFGALAQLYADQEDYVEIVGPAGAKVIESWNKETLQGDFLYEAIPDSSMPPDAAAERDLALNLYNLVKNDQFSDGEQLLRRVYEVYGEDPDRYVRAPEPTTPKPEARVNLSLKGEDLIPSNPQYQNVVNLMQALGVPAELSAVPTGPSAATGDNAAVGPAEVIDRERLRMAEADNQDQRAGGLVGVGE